MNGKEFANHIDVAHGTVKRWLHEGMPALRLRDGREVEIEAEPAKAWIASRYPHSIAVRRRSLVYFAQRAQDSAIKIGFTSDIVRRLRELRRHSRDAVEFCGAFSGGKPDELRMHARFSADRIDPEDEWFRPSENLVAFIDALGKVT